MSVVASYIMVVGCVQCCLLLICLVFVQDVFDKDMISKDFMGKVTLTAEKLKELSIKVERGLFLMPTFYYHLFKFNVHLLRHTCSRLVRDLAGL